MKYAGVIEFDSRYTVDKKEKEVKEIAKARMECEEKERQENYYLWRMKNFCRIFSPTKLSEEEYIDLFYKKLRWGNIRNVFSEQQLEEIFSFVDSKVLVGASYYLIFPYYMIEISSAFGFDVKTLIQALDDTCRLFFNINDIPGEEVFEFAVGKDKNLLCHYFRKGNKILDLLFPEKVIEFLQIQCEGNFDYLYDTSLNCVEIADRFSMHIGIPVIFNTKEKDVLLISGMTKAVEEETKNQIERVGLAHRRPDLESKYSAETSVILSDYPSFLQSKYIIAYRADETLLKKFPYQEYKAEKGENPIHKVERVDKYGKVNCMHLFRDDVSENALNDIFEWCEENLESYSVLIEPHYIGIWCVEWAGYDACFISKKFNCRVMDIEMDDDLTFSVTLIKSGMKMAYASFGECCEVMRADLGKKIFNVELNEHDDIYKGAVDLAEQTDCFIIWPEGIPTAKKIRNGDYGTVYIYPQTDSI